MKILHIASHDCFGGAARAAYRQHQALREQGAESQMLVRYRHSADPAAIVFSGNRSLAERIKRTWRRYWFARQEAKSRSKADRLVCGLTDPRADLLRELTPEIAAADVINFHKTERFVDLPKLFAALPANKPVVVTLHDLSPVTGGCDYPVECRRFEGECGRCPVLASAADADYSRRIFKWRQAAYATRAPQRFAFAADSRWTAEMAKKSGLARGFRVEVVHYGLDLSVYSTERRAEARAALGIGAAEPVVAFAAQNLSLKHKGGDLLLEALAKLPPHVNPRLLTMGSGQVPASSRFRKTHFGHLDSDELQVLIYRSADVFVIPSLEEAFGQTALEAAACGTLVTGFAVGGIVDIVQNDLNGRLVARGDAEALGRAISELLPAHDLRRRWQAAAADWMRERFSYERNATDYLALYQSLLMA